MHPMTSSPSDSETTAFSVAMVDTIPPPTAVPSSATTHMTFETSSVQDFVSFGTISIKTPALVATAPPTGFTGHSYDFSQSGSRIIISGYSLVDTVQLTVTSRLPRPSAVAILSLSAMVLTTYPETIVMTSFGSDPESSMVAMPPIGVTVSSDVTLQQSPGPNTLATAALGMPQVLFGAEIKETSPSASSTVVDGKQLILEASSDDNGVS